MKHKQWEINVFISFPLLFRFFLFFFVSFEKLFLWFPFCHRDYSSINDIVYLQDREKLFHLIERTFSRRETKINKNGDAPSFLFVFSCYVLVTYVLEIGKEKPKLLNVFDAWPRQTNPRSWIQAVLVSSPQEQVFTAGNTLRISNLVNSI